MDQFLKRCFYHSGLYNSEDHFLDLDSKLKEKEVIYLASPTSSLVLNHTSENERRNFGCFPSKTLTYKILENHI